MASGNEDDSAAGLPGREPAVCFRHVGECEARSHDDLYALYRVFVVPMLTSGRPGYQQATLNSVQMQLATDSIAQMPTSDLDKAASGVRDDSRRLVASAGSFGVDENTEGTALLTAFTQLAVDCTKAKYQPFWFQPATSRIIELSPLIWYPLADPSSLVTGGVCAV